MTTGNILSGADGAGGRKRSPRPPAVGLDGSGAGGSGLASAGGAGGASGARIRVLPDPEADLACSRLPLTDLGNAERWRVRHGADFRFCAELGWLHWQGQRWKLLSEEKDRLPAEVMQSVFATVRAIGNEAALVAASGHISGEDGQPHRLLHRLPKGWLEIEGRQAWFDALPTLDRYVNVNTDTKWSDKISAWAKTSEGIGKLNAVAALAKSFGDIAIKPDDLDADRMAINVLNGTLRFVRKAEKRSSEDVAAGKSQWRTGAWQIDLKPHNRADLITKLAPVTWSPAKKSPEYDAFMARVQPDETMRRFIHQWGGLSLTGDISEQKLAFFYGQGRNGKGTWVEAIAAIAGDYAGSIPIESFLDNGGKRRGDQATPDIARLPGVRFLRASEPEKGASLNEGLIKMVTGGDPVDARHLNKGFFTFLPSFKMTISGNHKPNIKDNSDGIWRRMQLVPWDVQIPAEEVDRKLGDKLRGEAPGILNRLLEGLLDWLTHGLIEPEAVRKATRAYRDDSDELGRFLSDICLVGDPLLYRVKSSDLHQYYTAWCDAAGGTFWKPKGFAKALRDKGFEQKQSNGIWWLGLTLKSGLTIDGVRDGDWPTEEPAPVGPLDDVLDNEGEFYGD